jgi:hypothetical protein
MDTAIQLVFVSVISALLIAYVVRKVRAGRRVAQLPKDRLFSAEPAFICEAALAVIRRLKYKVLTAGGDKVEFRTGVSMKSWTGQTMIVAIRRINGLTKVEVSGKANPSFQAYDWHEADFIAQRFLTELASELQETGSRT